MNQPTPDSDKQAEPKPVPQQPVKMNRGTPRFGLLLIVLVLAVIFVGVLTYVSEALYS